MILMDIFASIYLFLKLKIKQTELKHLSILQLNDYAYTLLCLNYFYLSGSTYAFFLRIYNLWHVFKLSLRSTPLFCFHSWELCSIHIIFINSAQVSIFIIRSLFTFFLLTKFTSADRNQWTFLSACQRLPRDRTVVSRETLRHIYTTGGVVLIPTCTLTTILKRTTHDFCSIFEYF